MVVDKSKLKICLQFPFNFVKNCYTNCFILDTSVSEIEETFKRFIKRDDIDIILINQNVSFFMIV
jgi:hypothetical protein